LDIAPQSQPIQPLSSRYPPLSADISRYQPLRAEPAHSAVRHCVALDGGIQCQRHRSPRLKFEIHSPIQDVLLLCLLKTNLENVVLYGKDQNSKMYQQSE
jgi:hypothetical protein